MSDCQVWIGNVPQGLEEHHLIAQLHAYGVFPTTAVYRARPAAEGFVVCTFASPELARMALGVNAVWSNGSFMLLRWRLTPIVIM